MREYVKTGNTTYSELDHYYMSVESVFHLFQDAMTEHVDKIGKDGVTLRHTYGALWVTAKTKIRFNRRLKMLHPYQFRTRVDAPGLVKVTRRFRMEQREELLASGITEMCVIDGETRKIRKLSSVEYPMEGQDETEFAPLTFTKIAYQPTAEERVDVRPVRYTDLDYSKHCNNVSYVRFLMDTFSLAFFEEFTVSEVEIHYIAESREGDTLSIYKKQTENGFVFAILNQAETMVAKATFTIEKQ